MSGPVEGGRLWGGYVQGVCPEKGSVCPEGVPYHVTYPMMHVILPTHPRAQTDTSKNITFPQLLLQVVNTCQLCLEINKNAIKCIYIFM